MQKLDTDLWSRAPFPAFHAGVREGQCYEELLEKFSGSASLHHDFANFCESVLNDEDRAIEFRQGADILESGRPLSSLGTWITATTAHPIGISHCLKIQVAC